MALGLSESEADLIVTETYRYGGLGGRVSERQTRQFLTQGNTRVFTQSFGYDDLGRMTSQTYPKCGHSPCADNRLLYQSG